MIHFQDAPQEEGQAARPGPPQESGRAGGPEGAGRGRREEGAGVAAPRLRPVRVAGGAGARPAGEGQDSCAPPAGRGRRGHHRGLPWRLQVHRDRHHAGQGEEQAVRAET